MNGFEVANTSQEDFGQVTFSDYQQNGNNYTVEVHTDAGNFCLEAICTGDSYYFCVEGYQLTESELPEEFKYYHRRNSPVDC